MNQFPMYPQHPIIYEDRDKVSKGRFVGIKVQINTDGHFYIDYYVENLQALAGFHGHGYLDIFGKGGDIIHRIVMPKLGVNMSWGGKVERHEFKEGMIKPECINNIGGLDFTGFENADSGEIKSFGQIIDWIK